MNHKEIIQAYNAKHPEFKQTKFYETLHKYLKDYGSDFEEIGRFQPDLYKFDFENRILHLVEVQSTNPLDDNKLRKIINLFWCLDDIEEWDFKLEIIDRCELSRFIDMSLTSLASYETLSPRWEE